MVVKIQNMDKLNNIEDKKYQPQELIVIGDQDGGILQSVFNNHPDSKNNHSYCYCIISPNKFMQMDSKPLEFTIADGWYCSLGGNNKVYISRHRLCKYPTAVYVKADKHIMKHSINHIR